MTLSQLVEDIKTDEAAWQTVQIAFSELRDLRAERQRLERMADEARLKEAEALDRANVALTVIKQRQEGVSG